MELTPNTPVRVYRFHDSLLMTALASTLIGAFYWLGKSWRGVDVFKTRTVGEVGPMVSH
jgi:hypothetical protein